jgi:nucleotide-binding universal stress UspA family protein
MPVLVGHVHTAEGHAALERALEEARLRGTPLHVLRVLREPTTDDPTQHRDWAEAVAQAQRDAAALERELAEEPVEVHAEVVVTTTSSPAEVVLETSRRLGTDLLVIGIRSRSRVGKLLLGSASQEILLKADCPVLAVKPDDR